MVKAVQVLVLSGTQKVKRSEVYSTVLARFSPARAVSAAVAVTRRRAVRPRRLTSRHSVTLRCLSSLYYFASTVNVTIVFP